MFRWQLSLLLLLLLCAPARIPAQQRDQRAVPRPPVKGTAADDTLLYVANGLLASDHTQAAALAGYTLGDGLTQKLRLFLISLRARDREAADALVSAALNAASAQHPARLFDVLMLWDYTYQPPGFY